MPALKGLQLTSETICLAISCSRQLKQGFVGTQERKGLIIFPFVDDLEKGDTCTNRH